MMNYIYFWKTTDKFGYMSQWYTSLFHGVDEKGFIITFTCAEQYMMYKKALLFRDFDTAKQILIESVPSKIKALGRQIKNFDSDTWDKNKFEIVVEGNYLKFSQDSVLRNALLATGKSIIAEASPIDKIWGIGLDEETASRGTSLEWQGENLLGKALMEVRDRLNKR